MFTCALTTEILLETREGGVLPQFLPKAPVGLPVDQPCHDQSWAASRKIILGDLPSRGTTVYPETHNLLPWLLLQPGGVEPITPLHPTPTPLHKPGSECTGSLGRYG